MTRMVFGPSLVAAALATVGCSAGPYGHARVYAPLDVEQKAVAGAQEFDPVMAKRMPDKWEKHKVSLFGIVVERKDLGGRRVDVTLSLRALEPRNLCENSEDDSCRVTVSDREFDRIHATLTLAANEDAAGPISIGGASLLRVVGSLEVKDGNQFVDAAYYRHWPRGYFVTTRSAPFMRR
jgi:hypothetical protein